MSCILRVNGQKFDIDRFVEQSSMRVCSSWRKGEARFREGSPNAKAHDSSGLNIEVSNADFSEFTNQLEDAIKFLKQSADEIRNLSSFPGVESLELDFGVESSPWCVYAFPSELVSLAGAMSIALCISAYPICEDEEPM